MARRISPEVLFAAECVVAMMMVYAFAHVGCPKYRVNVNSSDSSQSQESSDTRSATWRDMAQVIDQTFPVWQDLVSAWMTDAAEHPLLFPLPHTPRCIDFLFVKVMNADNMSSCL